MSETEPNKEIIERVKAVEGDLSKLRESEIEAVESVRPIVDLSEVSDEEKTKSKGLQEMLAHISRKHFQGNKAEIHAETERKASRMRVLQDMSFDSYQKDSTRTMAHDVEDFEKSLSNYCMGLSGETGEVVDELKKVLFHGKELDKEEIEKELGDVLWYLSAIAEVLDIKLSHVACKNIHKLQDRFPEGFKKIEDRENREGSGIHNNPNTTEYDNPSKKNK